MLTWKPKNKFRPYISVSMNKEYIESNWTKEAFEKAIASEVMKEQKKKGNLKKGDLNYNVSIKN